MLDVQAQPEQEPLGHLDPEAVVAADRLLALVGDQLDDVLNVLDFVLRPDRGCDRTGSSRTLEPSVAVGSNL